MRIRYLVYCVLGAEAPWRGRLPAGVEGAAVSLVTDGELAAAVSRVSGAGCAPVAAHATAFASVITALSADRTVLPVRYGCFFPSRTQVRKFLQARRAEFAALLDELDGCVEMGVRVLLSGAGCPARERRVCDSLGERRPREFSEPEARARVLQRLKQGPLLALRARIDPPTLSPPREGRCPATEPGSGRAYLAARSAVYARQDTEGQAGEAAAAAIRRTFNSLSVQSRAVPAVLGENLLVSMCFLIRREHVEAFRRRFRRLQQQGAYRLLLSGPWAPYNFVAAGPGGVR